MQPNLITRAFSLEKKEQALSKRLLSNHVLPAFYYRLLHTTLSPWRTLSFTNSEINADYHLRFETCKTTTKMTNFLLYVLMKISRKKAHVWHDIPLIIICYSCYSAFNPTQPPPRRQTGEREKALAGLQALTLFKKIKSAHFAIVF